MKISIPRLGLVYSLLAACPHVHGAVIAGPITNADNGNEYYLLAPNTWTASEAEAESLGGTLAVVTNSTEQNWIFSTFGSYGDVPNRSLWIGLHREHPNGPFVWITDAQVTFTNWSPGSPDNCGGNENHVHMWSGATKYAGQWNDAVDNVSFDGSHPNGVVEVPHEKALTEQEKALIGIWYESGKITRPCYFAGTTNMLFAIGKYGQSTKIINASEGHIFAAAWHARGEIVKDKILWSDGAWWSRTPSDYSNEEGRSIDIQLRKGGL
jgi:hypothetical protein